MTLGTTTMHVMDLVKYANSGNPLRVVSESTQWIAVLAFQLQALFIGFLDVGDKKATLREITALACEKAADIMMTVTTMRSKKEPSLDGAMYLSLIARLRHTFLASAGKADPLTIAQPSEELVREIIVEMKDPHFLAYGKLLMDLEEQEANKKPAAEPTKDESFITFWTKHRKGDARYN
jgi:hypothetical protein